MYADVIVPVGRLVFFWCLAAAAVARVRLDELVPAAAGVLCADGAQAALQRRWPSAAAHTAFPAMLLRVAFCGWLMTIAMDAALMRTTWAALALLACIVLGACAQSGGGVDALKWLSASFVTAASDAGAAERE